MLGDGGIGWLGGTTYPVAVFEAGMKMTDVADTGLKNFSYVVFL
jgi:hypothetical protein